MCKLNKHLIEQHSERSSEFHGCAQIISAPLTAPHLSPCPLSPAGGLSLWLVVWLLLGKPSLASACPHKCVCYPSPMTVSCQAQNFTAVPVGVPYESQRVFLQNNRIAELRVGSFGFGTQVKAGAEVESNQVY